MLKHPLVKFLWSLQGNPRACVFTEPLWGIPFNLYAPYASVFMLTLGVKDSQIGLISSIGMVLQVFFALISGALTDKFGRKLVTLITDLVSWSIPTLIWAVSQNFYYFLAAAVLNSTWRISMNSWTCLLVEDADPVQMVDIYSWIYISGLLAAFFAPVAGLLVQNFSLVPTVRILYVFAFFMMTTKFLVMNYFVKETGQGVRRMAETRGRPLFSLLSGYMGVFVQIIRTPRMLYTMGFTLIMAIYGTISGTFWPILVTTRLHVPAAEIALYPFVRSVVMLAFFFGVMPHISGRMFKQPMLVGLCTFILSQVLLVTMPERSVPLLLLSVVLEACSVALVNPFMDSLVARMIDPAERARIQAILAVVVISLNSPFGWIAGKLSEMNRILPFVLNIGLFIIGIVLISLAAAAAEKHARELDSLGLNAA